jgi:hypothetical protein
MVGGVPRQGDPFELAIAASRQPSWRFNQVTPTRVVAEGAKLGVLHDLFLAGQLHRWDS